MAMDNNHIQRRYYYDIIGLTEGYGELKQGKTITTTLKEIRNYCFREYISIKAFQGLKNYLARRFGVELRIYSQKTKPMANDETH